MYFGAVLPDDRGASALDAFCSTLAESTGIPVRPRPTRSSAELVTAVVDRGVDVAWAAPLVAIELEDRRAATPLVVVERTTRLGYHAALIVRTDSPIRKPEDLHRARVAWVDRESASGYRVPRWHLRSAGIDVRYAFASEREVGSHTAVVRAVLDREADVGATYATLDASGKLVSARWLDRDEVHTTEGAAEIRVIALVGPIPNDVIVASARVRASDRSRLLAALVSLTPEAHGPERTLFQAARFDPPSAKHFAVLRELMERGGDTNARA